MNIIALLVVVVFVWLGVGGFRALMHLSASGRSGTRYWAIVLFGVPAVFLRVKQYDRLWDWIERVPRTANVKPNEDEKPAG